MPKPHHVLVTGCAGTIGRSAVAALRAAGHTVRGPDLAPVPGGATPIITNSSSPKGGVVVEISSASTMMMPNHTGSKPSEIASGTKIGMVSIIWEI